MQEATDYAQKENDDAMEAIKISGLSQIIH